MTTPRRGTLLDVKLPQPLVDARWLNAHAAEVRVVDSRWYLDRRSGRDAYESGHLPGAVWVDVDRDLAAPATPGAGRHPLPTPEHFAAVLSRLGVDHDTPVVVYDDAGGSIAARLWWMLRMLEHPAAVLDGGLGAWTGPIEYGWRFVDALPCAPRPWPSKRLADADDIDTLRADPRALVLDARSSARFVHGDPKVDPRPGHVPGARSAPFVANLTRDGVMLDEAALRARYGALGAADAEVIACYCGSGVTACHDLLALEIAGFGESTRLYPGSWSQWGADTTRPAATGSDGSIDQGT